MSGSAHSFSELVEVEQALSYDKLYAKCVLCFLQMLAIPSRPEVHALAIPSCFPRGTRVCNYLPSSM